MAQTPILSSETMARFATDGLLRIPDLTTPADLVLIRSLLDPLFERLTNCHTNRPFDLAGESAPPGKFSIPEINRPSPVGYVFDHAIYKPPNNHPAADWHQDEAHTGRPMPQRTVPSGFRCSLLSRRTSVCG